MEKEILHIYRRVSTFEQSTKYSLQNQLDFGITKSKELGMDYKDWNEEGTSGSSENIEDREILTELYTQLQLGNVKHLYVFDLSRLSRNPIVSSLLRKGLEQNQVLLYTNDSNVDFKSDEQVLMYDFFSSINQFFVRVQRKKSMIGKVSHFQKGGWRGGTYPFGYIGSKIEGVRKLVIEPSESEWVRNMYEWYNNGLTINEIRKKLDKNGVKPRRGKFWNTGTILVMLKNDLYLGTDEMIDNITKPLLPVILHTRDENMRIIDDEIYNSVQIKIEQSLKKRNQLTKVIHKDILLRGLLYCGSCGEMYGCRIKSEKNEYYYYCRSKENKWRKVSKIKKFKCDVKKSINIKNTDDLVWNTLLEILSNSHIIKENFKKEMLELKLSGDIEKDDELLVIKKEKNSLQKKLKGFEVREKDNREWYLSGEIDSTQFEENKKVIKNSKDLIFKELDTLNIKITSVENTSQWINWLEKHTGWINEVKKTYTIKEKIEIVQTYIDKIDVNFDKKLNQHKLRIQLKLPIVHDRYVVNNDKVDDKPNSKDREYKILNGTNFIEKEVERTKLGRKREEIIGNNTIKK
jgi:DNA invertase Pin-like site-specific DNA recombinase